jgi:hypothetical protein
MELFNFFYVTIGLKQGDPLSPLLLTLFINDIAENLPFDTMTDKDLELVSMYLILSADDIVLFTTDPTSLQSQIDQIYNYSEKLGLKINVNKTKVCVFEKRKQVRGNEFFINGEKVEYVDNFTYLGVRLTYTGNMCGAVKALNDQALRAYNNLLSLL